MTLPKKTYDVNKIIHEPEMYKLVVRNVKDIIFNESFEARNMVVRVKMLDEDSEEVEFATTLKELLVNLILMKPFVRFGYSAIREYWFDAANGRGDIPRHFDSLIEYFHDEDVDALNMEIAESISELSDLGSETNLKVGSTVSVYELIRLHRKEPRLNEIFGHQFLGEDDFNVIEQKTSDMIKEVEEIIDRHPGSYRELLRGGAINLNQFKQMVVGLGPKPDLFGKQQHPY
jgi:hypothetical protein